MYEGSVPWETKDFISSNPNYVRECNVLYWAEGEGGGNAVFPKNTKNILTLSNPSLSRDKFWNGVAFTEVIQEVISNSKEHSRSKDQFVNGLHALYKTIEILSPDIVLFLGSNAMKDANYLASKKKLGEDAIECQYIDFVGKFKMREIIDRGVRFIGIPHPSLPTMRSKSNQLAWHNALVKHAPELITYINGL